MTNGRRCRSGTSRWRIARSRLWLASLGLLGLLGSACSESGESVRGEQTRAAVAECDAASIVECAPEGSTIESLIPDQPEQATGQPVRVGIINTESGPTAAFPELTEGARAGVAWLNEELGGVDGQPIELVTCDTQFSGTGSLACGQRMVEEGVVAVLGGLDVFGDAIGVLEDNGIPFVGGSPANFPAAESPLSFQFSGGMWGLALGLVHHIVNESDSERVSIMYGDFGPVTDGAMWAKRALIAQGMPEENINMVPMPIVVEDVLTPLQAADASDPDAIVVLVSDAGCNAAYQAVQEIGITAQTYWSATCLMESMIDSAGAESLEGYIYTLESSLDTEDPDLVLYNEVMARYGQGIDPGSTAAVGFNSLINLYDVLRTLGVSGSTPEAIAEQFRTAVDHPSFGGHPYTCDGRQMGGDLPAICAPQQVLAELRDGEIVPISGWIDVAALL